MDVDGASAEARTPLVARTGCAKMANSEWGAVGVWTVAKGSEAPFSVLGACKDGWSDTVST